MVQSSGDVAKGNPWGVESETADRAADRPRKGSNPPIASRRRSATLTSSPRTRTPGTTEGRVSMPGSDLPDRASLEYLKKLAKERLLEMRRTDPRARLAAAQRAVARDHGFPSWQALKAEVDRRRSPTARGLLRGVRRRRRRGAARPNEPRPRPDSRTQPRGHHRPSPRGAAPRCRATPARARRGP